MTNQTDAQGSDVGQVRRRYYYVDEAGDSTLFSARGREIVGTEGCSRFFMLGLLDVAYPETLIAELEQLRLDLLRDPYFRKVPSMQPGVGKTAVAFHAKDDVPEVRREVFKLLLGHELRFFGVVRDKRRVIAEVRERNAREETYRYHPNDLYDQMVARLCKTLLHKSDEYNIYFARRGTRDRTGALESALAQARASFSRRWGKTSSAPIHVHVGALRDCIPLQAVDYFLWAVQRLYESRREDRFVELMWPAIELIQDVDDKRFKPYGTYYEKKRPLTAAALQELPGI